MKALAKEVAAGLAFAAIGVVVSLAVVLPQGVEASPDEPRISWIYRGMVPFDGQQCYDWEHDPDPYWRQFHIDGWQSCWHLTEPGYPAIDYNRGDQTEDSAVWLDYDGDFQLFKIMPYAGYCTGVRAELYWGSYDPANYRGDVHYLHIEPNPLWLYQEVPYQAVYIGDVTGEDDPNCSWTDFHLHQSADASLSYPFCSNKFVNPSQGDNWQHKIYWLPGYTNDTDCDGFTDSVENYLDTDELDDCPAAVGSHDAWPLDIDMSTDIDVSGDVFNYVGRIGATPGDPLWWQRLDLDMSGDIDVSGDVFMYVGKIGMYCLP